jgi:hypothetical protein
VFLKPSGHDGPDPGTLREPGANGLLKPPTASTGEEHGSYVIGTNAAPVPLPKIAATGGRMSLLHRTMTSANDSAINANVTDSTWRRVGSPGG